MKPSAQDHPPYFEKYINLVKEDDLMQALKNQTPEIENTLSLIDEEKAGKAYATGKWTLKELLQHIIDTDRIFSYRAMCIARKETISLPSFDENLYAENSNANARTWKSLCKEYFTLRRSTEDLFESFNQDMLTTKGIAGDKPISVVSIGFILTGHAYHHLNIIKERYLQNSV